MAVSKKKKSSFNPDPDKEESEDNKETEGAEEGTPETETSKESESSEEEEGDEGDDDDEEDDDEDKDKDVEPKDIPIRKSTEQQIIGRQKRTIKKLRSKKDEESDETTEEDDSELSEEAESAVEKAVDKKITPVIKALASTVDQQELKDLYVENPAAKKYDKRIKAYMKNANWQGVPVLAIYRFLAWGDKKVDTEERKRIADKEAAHTQSLGRTLKKKKTSKVSTGAPSVEEVEGMTDAEIEALGQRAEQGEFLNQ